MSALKGWNVVDAQARLVRLQRPSLLQTAGALCRPRRPKPTQPFAFPVQWVEKFSSSRRHLPGPPRVLGPRGHRQRAAGPDKSPSCPAARPPPWRRCWTTPASPGSVQAGHSAGIVLDREVDVSRGDWLLAADTFTPSAAKSRPPWPGWTTSRWSPAASTGRCRPPLGQGQDQAHRAQAGHQHAGRRRRQRSWSPTPSATSSWLCRSRLPPLPYKRSRGWARWCWSIPPSTKPRARCCI